MWHNCSSIFFLIELIRLDVQLKWYRWCIHIAYNAEINENIKSKLHSERSIAVNRFMFRYKICHKIFFTIIHLHTRSLFSHWRQDARDLFTFGLTEGEASRVYVHLSDPNQSERCWQTKPRCNRTIAQKIRELVVLLQAKRGSVEHSSVQVARLLDLQFVDVAA